MATVASSHEADEDDLSSLDAVYEVPQGVDVTSQFNLHKTDDVIIDPPHDQLLSASDVTGADYESANAFTKTTSQDPGYSAVNHNGDLSLPVETVANSHESDEDDLSSLDDVYEDPQGVDVTSQFDQHETDDVIIDPPLYPLLSASDVTGADYESANAFTKTNSQDPGDSAVNLNGDLFPPVEFLPYYNEAVEMLTEMNVESSLQQVDFSPQNSAQYEATNGSQELELGEHTGQSNGYGLVIPENVTLTKSTPQIEHFGNTTITTDQTSESIKIEANGGGGGVLGVASGGGAAATYEAMNGSKLTSMEQHNSQDVRNNTPVNTTQHFISSEVASMKNSTMSGNDASSVKISDGNNIDIKPTDDFPGPDSAAGGQHESGNGSNSISAPSGGNTGGPSNQNLGSDASACAGRGDGASVQTGTGASGVSGVSGASCRSQQIFINDARGAVKAVDVKEGCTVEQFANKVADATGIPSDQTALVCRGRPLPRKGTMTLAALGILGASTVFQTVRGYGGLGGGGLSR